MASQIYNRFDPDKNYTDHRFVPGRPLQSSELNEIQSNAAHRLRSIADAILSDGNVVRDAGIAVNPTTGVTTCQAGAVYISGVVRGVAPATITVPVVGTIAVGLRLVTSVVTAQEDPDLLDPAVGTRAYNKEGAERTREVPVWAWSGDGEEGEFFPIYTVTDGMQNAKEPPPQLDAITQAVAKYDRDSTGGSYVVRGLDVLRLADAGGQQVFSVNAGRAYVNGFPIELQDSRRLTRAATPVTRYIENEPTLSTTSGAQRINVARAPIANVVRVSITVQTTVTIGRGTVPGTADPLPDDSVLSIQSVQQGGTTYVQGTDYTLAAGAVNWSPAGAEPAAGSTYTVVYRRITNATLSGLDDTGFTITGAVQGTTIQVSYNYKMPRVDRLCITEDGEFVWLEGASSDFNPVRPSVPSNLLALAQVVQFWSDSTRVINDGLRVLQMSDLEAMDQRLDLVVQLVAQQKLNADAAQRDAAAKKGMFVDPFLSDDLRDAGSEQSASVVRGELLLSVDATPKTPTLDPATTQTCPWESRVVLAQDLRTGSMKINPYMSFGQLPATAELTPAIDRWTETSVEWSSPITESFETGVAWGNMSRTSTATVTRSEALVRPLEFLRPTTVLFTLRGFGAGEILQNMTFDGLSVTPVAP